MTNQYIKMFFKNLGQEEHIRDLYENGTIYMNSIEYFRSIEDGNVRGDIFEGVSKITNYLPGKFEIPEINFEGNHLGIHLREHYGQVAGNIYSLYCISSFTVPNPIEFKIDEKNKSLWYALYND